MESIVAGNRGSAIIRRTKGAVVVAAAACLAAVCVVSHAEEDRDFKKGCRQCHEDKIGRWDVAAVQHYPYKKQKCESCHALEHKKFTAEAGKPCAICHDFNSEKIKKAHGAADVTGTDCSMCHYTHGAERKGLLKEVVHPPFEERMCDACHRINAEGRMELMAKAEDICKVCHSDKKPLAGETLHPAPEMSACTDCHTPHTASRARLLKETVTQTCFGCHEEDTAKKHPYDVTPSPRIVMDRAADYLTYEGQVTCVSCHEPHKSALPFLLRDSLADNRLCRHCHPAGAKK